MSILADLLQRDSFALLRPQGGADAEGNPFMGFAKVGDYRGTWGGTSAISAADMGKTTEVVEAVCATLVEARPGDRLANLRDATWEVLYVQPVHTHWRLFLRRVE